MFLSDLIEEREIRTEMASRRPLAHYCGGCKRHVPLAPGVAPHPAFTVGVAHVIQDPMCRAVPCRSQRTYHPDEQRANLDAMEFES